MYFHSSFRLIIFFCVGSIICENRRERKLHPKVYQPLDYRCPCVPSDSCSHSTTQELSPCIDIKKVRCCSILNISDARIHLGVEPLTSVVTTINSVEETEKEEEKELASIDSVNFTLNKMDEDIKKEIKVDFNIDELNNRNMKAIKQSSTNIINTSNQDTKTYNDNKTILENIPVVKTEHKKTVEDSIFDIDEMINNTKKIDFIINLNINKSYNDNKTINEKSKLIKISSNSRKYQIIYPNISRVRDESKRKLIVYPIKKSEDNFEIGVDDINSSSNTNKTNYTKENNNDELKENNSDNISTTTPPIQHVVKIVEHIQDDNKSESNLEDFNEHEEEEYEDEIDAEEEEEEVAEEDDEMPSSSELLEYILKFGKKTNVQEFTNTDRQEPVSTFLDIEQPKVVTKTGTKQFSEEENISEENKELESLPTAAASEIVEQIVMPEPEENLENESKTRGRTPIRLPSRNLKLQIQGVSRPQVRQSNKKRNNPLININNSNIKEIINNQKYGKRLEKVELSKPTMIRNSKNNTKLESKTMKPSQSFNLDPNLNTEEVLSESRLHPRGIFTPPSNVESGFLPMVGQSDLSIVGPIPLGFQDRSKQNDFLTEDGIRISDLNPPSNKAPQLFFSVYQQNNTESVDSAHPELPESEPKDFLSRPNNEGDSTKIYEVTEDGVYIVQLPLPAEGEPKPFRSEQILDSQNNEDAEIDYKQYRTGPADHHNVDIELESKETDDQINIKEFPQNLEDTRGKINIQLPSPLVSLQNFRSNSNEHGNLGNDFQKDLPENKFTTQTNFVSHSNDQNYVDLSSSKISEKDLQFKEPNQIGDTISTSQQLPSKIQTNFLSSQNDQNNEFSLSPLEGKVTQFQPPIRDFKSTQTMQQSNVENANKLRFLIPTFQLPLKNAAINFQTNDNNGVGSQQNLPLPQDFRQNHEFVSTQNNQKMNVVSLQQGFPTTQPFLKSNPLNFAPSPRDQLNNGVLKKPTISLNQQLPQTNILNFLHNQNEQTNRNVSSEQFPINKQLPQKPLNLLPPQNDQTNTVSHQESLTLSHQQPQNKLLKFKELNNIDPNFHQRFLLSQQLPQTEVLNFAPAQNELTNNNSFLRQQLPSNQGSVEPTLIKQKLNENILQKTQQTVAEILPVQNDFQTKEPIQRNPLKSTFQQNTKPRSEVAQDLSQILRPNNKLPVRPITNDHQTRPNMLNQPPRMTQAIIKPSEFSSQGFKTTANSFDTEKTKYDIALEKYKADLKIYQDQYDAFLRKKFPSVIRIF